MFKNILQLYALLVCFVTTVVLLVVASISLDAVGDIVWAEAKNPKKFSTFRNNEAFLAEHKEFRKKNLSEDELSKVRDQKRQDLVEDTKNNAKGRIFDWLASAIIAAVFFLIHWRLYRRASAQ